MRVLALMALHVALACGGQPVSGVVADPASDPEQPVVATPSCGCTDPPTLRWSTPFSRVVAIAVGPEPAPNGALPIGVVGQRARDGGFVASVDADTGSVRWQRELPGYGVELATVAVDSAGQTVITGTFDRLDLRERGPLLKSQHLSANDAFIASYDAEGSLSWIETWGGLGDEHVYAAALDPAGGAVIAFSTSAYDPDRDIPNPDFGGGERPIIGLVNPFFIRFDEAGNYASDAPIGDEYTDLRVRSMVAVHDGWALAGSIKRPTVDGSVFDEGEVGFVARYDRAWSERWSSLLGKFTNSLTLSGDALVVGGFATSEDLQPGGFGATQSFIAGLDADQGTLRWRTMLPPEQAPQTVLETPHGGLLVESTGQILHLAGDQVCWSRPFEPESFSGFAAPPAADVLAVVEGGGLQLLVPCRAGR